MVDARSVHSQLYTRPIKKLNCRRSRVPGCFSCTRGTECGLHGRLHRASRRDPRARDTESDGERHPRRKPSAILHIRDIICRYIFLLSVTAVYRIGATGVGRHITHSHIPPPHRCAAGHIVRTGGYPALSPRARRLPTRSRARPARRGPSRPDRDTKLNTVSKTVWRAQPPFQTRSSVCWRALPII
jgi:hypothetical protein